MHISMNNSKLGDKIPSINFPVSVCRNDVPCKKDRTCYAMTGNWTYPNVKNSLQENLNEFLADPVKFEKDLIQWLNSDDIIYRFFRWFGSGDIVNEKFFDIIVNVARACPQTKFLCFTKKFNIVNDWIRKTFQDLIKEDPAAALSRDVLSVIPENLKIVFSGWDENFKIENPFDFPTTSLYFKGRENKHISEFAIPCTGSCISCKSCWSLQPGQSVYFNKH